MSFRLVRRLCKWCCVMPLREDGQDDRPALVLSVICVALAAAESVFGIAWYARVIATDRGLGHAMKVDVMLSVVAKVVNVAQVGAVGLKLLRGRRRLGALLLELKRLEGALLGRCGFSWEVLATSGLMVVTTLATFFAYLQHYETASESVGWRVCLNMVVTFIKLVNCCVVSGINLMFWGFCQALRTSFKAVNSQLFELASKGSTQPYGRKNILAKLQRLRSFRSRLCDAVDALNDLFGMCVLLALLSYNIYLHLVVYLMLTELISFVYDAGYEANLGTTLVWLAIDLFFVSTYFQGCIRTSHEVGKTSKVLSHMSHSLPCGALRDTVYWFLTEVNSRPIIFSANGVFRIDLPLLFVSLASCAVNMAILLQSTD